MIIIYPLNENEVINESSKTTISNFTSLVTDIQYVYVNKKWVLVIAQMQAVHIYSEDGKKLLLIFNQ